MTGTIINESPTVNARKVADWVLECARVIDENLELLNELDSTCGDADHGSNLRRGFTGVRTLLGSEPGDTPAAVLKKVGTTLVSQVGGSSGALYGTFFLRMALAAGQDRELDRAALGQALEAAARGITERGQVQVGDKTLYDSLAPAVEAYSNAQSEGRSLVDSMQLAAKAAEEGRDSTLNMTARKGRASYLGGRTIGHADAGATSMALILRAAAETLRP